jgi:hypothetical protein
MMIDVGRECLEEEEEGEEEEEEEEGIQGDTVSAFVCLSTVRPGVP